MYKYLDGKIPIIGVGGITKPEHAYQKILHGASVIQIYSGFIFHGPDFIYDINKYIDQQLKKDGFKNIEEAIGSIHK